MKVLLYTSPTGWVILNTHRSTFYWQGYLIWKLLALSPIATQCHTPDLEPACFVTNSDQMPHPSSPTVKSAYI